MFRRTKPNLSKDLLKAFWTQLEVSCGFLQTLRVGISMESVRAERFAHWVHPLRFRIGVPLLRLEDERAPESKDIVHPTEESPQTFVSPVEMNPL